MQIENEHILSKSIQSNINTYESPEQIYFLYGGLS